MASNKTKPSVGKSTTPASVKRSAKQARKAPAVLQMLRERIANGDLPPGSKLNEYELAKEFEVPRTRIRDAFLALDQRGLIERIPNRGKIGRASCRERVCQYV